MQGKITRLFGVLIAATVAAYGCSSDSSMPVAPEGGPSRDLITSIVTSATDVLTPVDVLKRTTPLSRSISKSANIGKNGGTIEIREAGIRFIVPSNSLIPPSRQNSVTITVTALPGDEVAYEFQPHGLVFREPVRIEQEIKGTNAELNRSILSSVEGAYYPSLLNLNTILGIADVTEFRPTSVDVSGSRIKFTIDHFSGYLIASGRRSTY